MTPPSKRRKVDVKAVEEVTFNFEDRQDYLTGFHKRKLQRAKHAREMAEKKARAEKIEERKKLRDERKVELERHVQEVNALLRSAQGFGSEDEDHEESTAGSTEEWVGLVDLPAVDHEAEYVDEDRYTTVTIAEMDISREGLHNLGDNNEDSGHLADNDQVALQRNILEPKDQKTKRIWTKNKPKNGIEKPKKKRKKFRYETKTERKLSRTRERLKNSKQASARRAG